MLYREITRNNYRKLILELVIDRILVATKIIDDISKVDARLLSNDIGKNMRLLRCWVFLLGLECLWLMLLS